MTHDELRSAPSMEHTELGSLAGDEDESRGVASDGRSAGATGPGGARANGRPRQAGDSVGRYLLLNELGAGAMGVVWAAYDPELDRRVALKLLRWAGGTRVLRLQREAQALARLDHTNVVSVFDVGVDAGETWLAMELVEGETLRSWLGRTRLVVVRGSWL